MSGLEKPDSGSVLINNIEITSLDADSKAKLRNDEIGFVYQYHHLLPDLNAIENIALPSMLADLSREIALERAKLLLDQINLSGKEYSKPNELSGGQQQRTALARALVKDSDLILLDEPLANLDFKLREELREELPKLFENRDCIVVYATTEPSEALLLGGNTATLQEGKIIQYGKTLDTYNKPNSLVSAQVFSDPPMNIAKIKKTGDQCSFLQNDIQWKTKLNIKDGEYKVGIRPHNITTYKEGNNTLEIKGKVLISEISGSESLIHFTNGNLNWVSLSNGVFQKNVGDEMNLYMNTDEFVYFDQNERLVSNG